MSHTTHTQRHQFIIAKLKSKRYCTFQELETYLNHKQQFLIGQGDTANMGFSKRTFQRDINEIRSNWGYEIEYSKTNRGYSINSSLPNNNVSQRMADAFALGSLLNIADGTKTFVHFDNRQPQGMEHFYGLLHAIKNQLQVAFAYQKFYRETVSERTVEPYLLKEFRNRWYLIARDVWDGNIKTYALDRFVEMNITNRKFTMPIPENLEAKYRYCFGITVLHDEDPQDVVLSFSPFQGKYIKTLPLHQTQQNLLDNEEEFRVQLKLYITHELIMELLSYGDNVKVLQPVSLAKEIKQAYQNAIEQY